MINNHRKCGLPLGNWIFRVGYWLFCRKRLYAPLRIKAKLFNDPLIGRLATGDECGAGLAFRAHQFPYALFYPVAELVNPVVFSSD
jgi:hypothetical protein